MLIYKGIKNRTSNMSFSVKSQWFRGPSHTCLETGIPSLLSRTHHILSDFFILVLLCEYSVSFYWAHEAIYSFYFLQCTFAIKLRSTAQNEESRIYGECFSSLHRFAPSWLAAPMELQFTAAPDHTGSILYLLQCLEQAVNYSRCSAEVF